MHGMPSAQKYPNATPNPRAPTWQNCGNGIVDAGEECECRDQSTSCRYRWVSVCLRACWKNRPRMSECACVVLMVVTVSNFPKPTQNTCNFTPLYSPKYLVVYAYQCLTQNPICMHVHSHSPTTTCTQTRMHPYFTHQILHKLYPRARKRMHPRCSWPAHRTVCYHDSVPAGW